MKQKGWFGEPERHNLAKHGIRSNKVPIRPAKFNFRNTYRTHNVAGMNISLGDEIIFPPTSDKTSKGCVVFVSDDMIYVMLTKWNNKSRYDNMWITLWDYELESGEYKVRKNMYSPKQTNEYIDKVKHDIVTSP